MRQEQNALIVYPDRRKLMNYLGKELLGFCFLVGGLTFYQLTTPDSAILGLMWIVIGSGSIFLTGLIVATLYRLRVHQPSLMVNTEGIVDNCSVIFSGVGLIPWGEIRSVFTYNYHAPLRGNFPPQPYLVITIISGSDLGAFVHPLIKMLERLLTMTLPSGVCVPQSMLDVTIEALVDSIKMSHPSKVQMPGAAIEQSG